MSSLPTQERLHSLLLYDPFTGIFTHRHDYGRSVKSGDIAGSIYNSGYRMMSVDGERILAHRLAWFYMTGKWPVATIDHSDLDSLNNRWLNLREATQAQNQMNRPARRTNKLGIKGVHQKANGKYIATIRIAGKSMNLGTFLTPDEAKAAYDKAANDNFGAFARSA